jgi:succinate dehydrogenase / fumarate reductase cytochrome b subunit
MTPANPAQATGKACGCKHHLELRQAGRPVCSCQRLVWPRRTHALSGALFGCFLAIHFAIAATALSPDRYQGAIDGVQAMVLRFPALVAIAVFLPLAWQIGSGLYLLRKEGMRYNVRKCNRGGKLRFFAQRASAIAILAFAAFHVATLHEWGLHGVHRLTGWTALDRYAAGGLFDPRVAFRSTVAGMSGFGGASAWGNAALAAFSLLGVGATVFHFANGVWSGSMIWKLASAPEAKRMWSRLAIVLGVALGLCGAAAWYAFTLSSAARGL